MRFLITWTTYGSWLPGNPRGFRTRGAKEYVPPPERYTSGEHYVQNDYKRLYERSLSKITHPVSLNKQQRQTAAAAIAEVCSKFVPEAVIAVTRNHAHLLVDLPSNVTVGYFCGRVKSVSSLKLSSCGLRGRVWARKYHAKRIQPEDAGRVRRYVISHKDQHGAIIEMKPRV